MKHCHFALSCNLEERITMITDDLGNEYETKAEMCRCYHIAPSVYDGRLKRGLLAGGGAEWSGAGQRSFGEPVSQYCCNVLEVWN